MADVKFAVIKHDLEDDVADADVDFTQSGFGTVKAAIVFISDANTGSNPSASYLIGIGFWDGTNVRSCAISSGDNLDPTDTYRTQSATRIVAFGSGPTADYNIAAQTDGITISMQTDNTGARRYATAILFGGDDVSADVGTMTMSASVDTATTESGLSYTADLIFTICGGAGSAGNNAHSIVSFGVGDSSLNQRCVYGSDPDNLATTNATNLVETDRITGQLHNGSLSWAGELTDVDSAGFDLTTRTAGSGSDLVYWLALNFGGASVWLDTLSTPTSIGDDALTGPGFKPGLLISVGTGANSVDAINHTGCTFSLGASDGTTDETVSARSEDNAAASNVSSNSKAQVVDILSGADGIELVSATLSSFDTNGFTRNYSAVDGSNNKKGWDVAIEEAAAGAGLHRHPLKPFIPNLGR